MELIETMRKKHSVRRISAILSALLILFTTVCSNGAIVLAANVSPTKIEFKIQAPDDLDGRAITWSVLQDDTTKYTDTVNYSKDVAPVTISETLSGVEIDDTKEVSITLAATDINGKNYSGSAVAVYDADTTSITGNTISMALENQNYQLSATGLDHATMKYQVDGESEQIYSTPVTLVTGKKCTVTVTADTDYILTTVPTEGSLSADKKTWTYDIPESQTSDVSLSFAASKKTYELSATGLDHATMKYQVEGESEQSYSTPVTLVSGKKCTVTVTAKTDYILTTVPTGGSLSANKKTWTYEIPASQTEGVSLSFAASKTYELSATGLVYATMKYQVEGESEQSYSTPVTLVSGKKCTVTVTADTNYILTTVPTGGSLSADKKTWTYEISASQTSEIALDFGTLETTFKIGGGTTEVYADFTYEIQSGFISDNTDKSKIKFSCDIDGIINKEGNTWKLSIPKDATYGDSYTIKMKYDNVVCKEVTFTVDELALTKGEDYKVLRGNATETGIVTDGTVYFNSDNNQNVYLQLLNINYNKYRIAKGTEEDTEDDIKAELMNKDFISFVNEDKIELSVGEYYLQMKGDSGTSEVSGVLKLVIDNTPPAILGLSKSAQNAVGSVDFDKWAIKKTVTFTVEDIQSGVSKVYYSEVDGLSVAQLKESGNDKATELTESNNSYSFTISDDLDEQGKTYYIYAVDAVDNLNNEEVTISKIDTVDPEVSLEWKGNVYDTKHYVNNESVATLTITDKNFKSDIFSTAFSVANSNFKLEGPQSSGDKHVYDIKLKSTETSFSLANVSVYDEAENSAEVDFGTNSIIYDATPPVLTGEVNDSGELTLTLKEENPKDEGVLNGIEVYALDAEGNDVVPEGKVNNTPIHNIEDLKGTLCNIENWSENESTSTYTTTITLTTEALYSFKASCTDKADNEAEKEYETGEIVFDKTEPVVEISVDEKTKKRYKDYGNISNKPITVKVTMSDKVSGIDTENVEFELVENGDSYVCEGKLVDKDSKKNENTNRYSEAVMEFKIPKSESQNFKGKIVKVLVKDNKGNEQLMTEQGGLIIESKEYHDNEEHLKIDSSAYNKNDFYNQDVALTLSASDTYSGLKSVKYTLNQTSTTAVDNTNADTTIQSDWKENVILSATKENEGNDIHVELSMEDNAGNISTIEETYKIDVTKPVVTVEYDNNSPANDKYYNQTRTATITIDEVNLNTSVEAGDVKLIVTRDGASVNISPNFTKVGNTYKMLLPFAEDGDYTFTISVEDMAGNKADYNRVDEFTIDQTKPVIQIAYDNNRVMNGSYYGEARTATVTIEEHNFDAASVNMAITATNAEANVAVPTISGFTSNGDTHTATIAFASDADYTISGTLTDMAGNEAVPLSEDRFTVDLTEPVIEISSVEAGASYNGMIMPVVTVTDTNFDVNNVTIEIVGGKNGTNGSVNYTKVDIVNGAEYMFADFDHVENQDDYYTLHATVTDMAGHVKEETINFRVNRFGSVYTLDTYTQNAVDNFYTNAEQDFVIIETNVDELKNVEIYYSKDGDIVDLKDGVDYETTDSENNAMWKEYTYTIDKDKITEEGIYTFSVYSEDVAGNKTDNKSKGMNIEFCIDRTAPSCVITGIENNGVYEQESITAVVDVYDNIYLDTVEVTLNGKTTKYKSEDIQDGKIRIDIPESNSEQSLSVRSIDGAGNVYDTAESGVIKFTVSSNVLATTLAKVQSNGILWIVIAVCVLALVVVFLVFFFKKRQNNHN